MNCSPGLKVISTKNLVGELPRVCPSADYFLPAELCLISAFYVLSGFQGGLFIFHRESNRLYCGISKELLLETDLFINETKTMIGNLNGSLNGNKNSNREKALKNALRGPIL